LVLNKTKEVFHLLFLIELTILVSNQDKTNIEFFLIHVSLECLFHQFEQQKRHVSRVIQIVILIRSELANKVYIPGLMILS